MKTYSLIAICSLALIFNACAATPSIETRHRPIPHIKKYEAPLGSQAAQYKKTNPSVTQDNITVFNKALEEARANEARLAQDAKAKAALALTPTAPSTQLVSATTTTSVTTPVSSMKFADLNFDLKTDSRPRSSENIPTDSKKIGLILPLTGKNGGVGQRALNAIRLAFGLNDTSVANSFSLAIFDNQSNP